MARKKVLFTVSLIFGSIFINAGLNKFFNYMSVPKDLPADSMQMFTAIMQIDWLMPLIGVAEVVGGILFIITKTRVL